MTEDNKVAPDAQEFVGASEAASIMDIELSTFSHLRRREAKDGTSKFPTPVAVLRCGPIWKTRDIKRFAARYIAPKPGPKPAPPVRKTVAKLPAKVAPVKTVSKKAVASNGEADKTPRKRQKRKIIAKKTVSV